MQLVLREKHIRKCESWVWWCTTAESWGCIVYRLKKTLTRLTLYINVILTHVSVITHLLINLQCLFLLSLSGTNNSESKRPKKKKKPSSLLLSSAGVCEREKGGERGERERGGGVGGGGLSSVSGLGGAGTSTSSSSSNSQSALTLSNRKKRPRPPPPPVPNIYDGLN